MPIPMDVPNSALKARLLEVLPPNVPPKAPPNNIPIGGPNVRPAENWDVEDVLGVDAKPKLAHFSRYLRKKIFLKSYRSIGHLPDILYKIIYLSAKETPILTKDNIKKNYRRFPWTMNSKNWPLTTSKTPTKKDIMTAWKKWPT
jgi:hypothetical protein